MTEVRDFTAIVAMLENNSFRWNAGLERGQGAIVTYSFTEDGALGYAPAVDPYGASEYIAFSETQRDHTRAAFAQFETNVGLRFVEVDGPAMINLYATPAFHGNIAGWGHYPYSSLQRAGDGDIVVQLDHRGATSVAPGTFEYEVILHEIGHGLGLSHPHEGDLTLVPDLDNNVQTVMTYNFGTRFSTGPGVLDVQALQYIYGTDDQFDGWTISAAQRGGVRIEASDADDTILAPGQDSRMFGGRGADELVGREGDDFQVGGMGNDTLTGGDGADKLFGRSGNDRLLGGTSSSGYSGHEADTLDGGNGHDTLYGGGGRDQLNGGHGRDLLYGGEGVDVLRGGNKGDQLMGDFGQQGTAGSSRDHLHGGNGNDSLYGDGGNDRLFGGRGQDVLYGGRGRDMLHGGSGADVFVFTWADKNSRDVIRDFESGQDRIDFSDVFLGLDAIEDLSITQRFGHTFVSAADVEIKLDGYTAGLTADDFLFS